MYDFMVGANQIIFTEMVFVVIRTLLGYVLYCVILHYGFHLSVGVLPDFFTLYFVYFCPIKYYFATVVVSLLSLEGALKHLLINNSAVSFGVDVHVTQRGSRREKVI